MSLTVVAEAHAAPGREDRLRTALEALIEPSLEEPGCLAYRAYVDPNDRTSMVVVEEWRDQESLDAHFTTPHIAHAVKVFDFVLAEPMSVRVLAAPTRPPGYIPAAVRALSYTPPMTETAVVIDEQGRPEPDPATDEAGTLTGFLDYQRATLAWKVRGLDSAGLNATTAASTMTLGGLLKHMAYVENHWFWNWFNDQPKLAPWDTVDWKADADWDWHSAADDSPEELLALWQNAVELSRTQIAEALADGGLGRLSKRLWPDGRTPNLRWIMVHMIEEYARHNGHADLLRESIDGETGE
jgi:quinol monooxygenase YgiN/uncharacterized damage-inducible protein DinB